MLWFHCDQTTGAIVSGGIAADKGTAELNSPSEGQVLVMVPDGSVTSPFSGSPDFSTLKRMLLDQIDAEAEATRLRFITSGSGQAMTYLRKETEAAAYLADSAVPTPFLTAEAAATGKTVGELAATVAARAAAWTIVGPKIEAARLAAKIAVNAGSSIPAIQQAAAIDWDAVVNVEG